MRPRIRAGRKSPQTGYRSARQQIEGTPRIITHEMGWYKVTGKPGKMHDAVRERAPGGIKPTSAMEEHRSFIHTHHEHGTTKRVRRKLALPSHADLAHLLTLASAYVPHAKVKYFHIATVDRKGKVIGYTSIKFRKLTKAEESKADWLKRNYDQYGGPLGMHKGSPRYNEVLKFLLDNKWIRLKFHPMPGYQFVGGRFVKKVGGK